jgi:hypothetical protein
MNTEPGKLIFLVLDDVPPEHERAYLSARSKALAELRQWPAVARTFAYRGAREPPAGVKTCDQQPNQMALVELSGPAPAFDGSLLEIFSSARALGRPVLCRPFYETNPAQRSGPFLAGPAPTSVFLIVQDVPPEQESAYNYWFDVDDGSGGGGSPVSHYAERLRFAGFQRATRMRAVPFAPDGAKAGAVLTSNYVTLFEISSISDLQSEDYVAATRKSSARPPVQRPFALRVRHGYAEQPNETL